MRRWVLVNALIFAVLAAAAALAYYAYVYTSETSGRDREQALMRELAVEKVVNIDSLVAEADTKLLSEVPFDLKSEQPNELIKATGAAVSSLFVLDADLNLIPNGNYGRPGAEGKAFSEWFLAHVVPHLDLQSLPLNVRGHRHAEWERNGSFKPYLFSFMKRNFGDKTFYVVIEDDVNNHLILGLFPQFFASKRFVFNVVDERGGLIFGKDYLEREGDLVVSVPFVQTVDGWALHIIEQNSDATAALARKHLVDSVLIGGATGIIVVGLIVLGFAIRRERRLNELKSEFISNVSHELKTPLSIISMFGEMLAEGRTKSPEQQHEYAEIIWRESVRLGRLIDNVLDFAKIERGKNVYEFAETDLGEVVDRAIDLAQRRVAKAGMALAVDLEPDLPLVKLDGNAFTLAVLNLIDNAIKYAPDGKTIDVKLARDGDARVALAVTDHGPGIAADEQDKIFERFYRAKAIRLKPIRGSGIGLALVRHIARAHKGDVTVSSTPGNGATFKIWLPA